jgi:hypothetical protein
MPRPDAKISRQEFFVPFSRVDQGLRRDAFYSQFSSHGDLLSVLQMESFDDEALQTGLAMPMPIKRSNRFCYPVDM